jgi:phosphogluconate dehydratase
MTFAFPLLPPPLGTGRELFPFMRPGADGTECGVSAMLASTEAEL